jgi:hypothetical protein
MISFDIARIFKGTITKPTWLEVVCLALIGGLVVLVMVLMVLLHFFTDPTIKKADLERSAWDSCVGCDYSASTGSSPGSPSVKPPA